MRRLLVLALLLVPICAAHAVEVDLASHLQQIGDASPEGRPAAMEHAAQAMRGLDLLDDSGRANCAALLGLAQSAAASKEAEVSSAGWKLALSSVAALRSANVAIAAWLLQHVEQAWKARGDESTARAAIVAAVVALFADGTVASKEAKTAEGALKKALRAKGEPPLFVSIAVGLARSPTERARKLLAKGLRRKGLESKDVALILEALGQVGGVGAVPILLDHVPKTEANVLEAALVALHRLDAETLRKHGKKILDVTLKTNEAHRTEMLGLTRKSNRSRKEQARHDLLAARAYAWITDRIVDVPPMRLPSPANGMRGVVALWWKVIDALEGRIRPPKAAETAQVKFMNGRPNVVGLGWYLWWRSER